MPKLTAQPRRPRPASNAAATSLSWEDWLRSDPQLDRPAATGHVLLISYEFPPTGGSGVQRPARLAGHLARLGCDVEVLTAAHDRFPWRDESLLQTIPATCRIHRVAGLEPACLARTIADATRCLLSADRRTWFEDRLYWRLIRLTAALSRGQGEQGWIGAAVRSALKIHRQRPLDAVISTGPPHFTHQIARQFQHRTGVPWLADLRDPLVSDFSRTAQADSHDRKMRRLERAILRHASMVITTCPSLAHDFRTRYPARSPQSIQAITNGFDRQDFRRALLNEAMPPSNQNAAAIHSQFDVDPQTTCLLVAAGSLYGRREISCFVDPLATVFDRHPEWRSRVRLVLAGSIDARQRAEWELHRPDWLHLAGYLDHASALRLTASAACNLVLVPDCSHGRLSIPGKTFELIALPAHVLALAPDDSDTANVVRSAGASTVAPLESPARLASAFETIIADHFAGKLARSRDWPSLDVYDRSAIATQFACALNHIRRRSCP